MSTYTPAADRCDGQIETDDCGESVPAQIGSAAAQEDSDAWDPAPCQLREGADRDVSGHAARNIAMLRDGARDGAISLTAARESIERIRSADRRLKVDPADTADDHHGY